MKKISLNEKLTGVKQLSKQEMKKITGGYGCCCACYGPNDCFHYVPSPGLGCQEGTYSCAQSNCG